MADEQISSHIDHLIGEKKNKFTFYVREAGKVEEISNVKILYKDHVGYTIEAIKYLGKNRRIFIPLSSVSHIRSELH